MHIIDSRGPAPKFKWRETGRAAMNAAILVRCRIAAVENGNPTVQWRGTDG
jgi:hypothetical protein